MTPERLGELVSKVSHGYNLINSEARELMEHFGVAVEQRKRCLCCGGDLVVRKPIHGVMREIGCPRCYGTGYEVRT